MKKLLIEIEIEASVNKVYLVEGSDITGLSLGMNFEWDLDCAKVAINGNDKLLSYIKSSIVALIPQEYRSRIKLSKSQMINIKEGCRSISTVIMYECDNEINELFPFDMDLIGDEIKRQFLSVKDAFDELNKRGNTHNTEFVVSDGTSVEGKISLGKEVDCMMAVRLRGCGKGASHIILSTLDGTKIVIDLPKEKAIDVKKKENKIIRGRVFFNNSLNLKVGILKEGISGVVTRRHEKVLIVVEDYVEFEKLQDAHRGKLIVELDVSPVCRLKAGEVITKAYSLNRIIDVDESDFNYND